MPVPFVLHVPVLVPPDTIPLRFTEELLIQTDLLLPALTKEGAVMMTFVLPGVLVQPFTVAVTKYCPAFAIVILATELFWFEEIKPLGPVQL